MIRTIHQSRDIFLIAPSFQDRDGDKKLNDHGALIYQRIHDLDRCNQECVAPWVAFLGRPPYVAEKTVDMNLMRMRFSFNARMLLKSLLNFIRT